MEKAPSNQAEGIPRLEDRPRPGAEPTITNQAVRARLPGEAGREARVLAVVLAIRVGERAGAAEGRLDAIRWPGTVDRLARDAA